ncbi:MAG TPA: gamma-glutamyl-gamma-aminobutyrate hydrolase family protein [Bryobacteraceae bacterium]|nr:gamma-glutamyl-gamma-aminobutyrate hydrolase family protein [Bryobacteraceae bacterium]
MPGVEGKVLAVCGSVGHWAPEKSLPYEKALRQAGIEPLLISPGDAAPSDFSGLLLMGGSDVNPARYGEKRHSETGDPDDARDQFECALIADALRREVPLLAICRGVQILNVQHGGTLVQHLDTTERHRVRNPDRGLPAHLVDVTPGTRLAAIAGTPLRLDVNSRHHQAIAKPGAGLLVTARDPKDGTIEAVERTDRRFVVGVQWHPENQIESDARALKLFQAFAAAV